MSCIGNGIAEDSCLFSEILCASRPLAALLAQITKQAEISYHRDPCLFFIDFLTNCFAAYFADGFFWRFFLTVFYLPVVSVFNDSLLFLILRKTQFLPGPLWLIGGTISPNPP